jgi:hypothetical protein
MGILCADCEKGTATLHKNHKVRPHLCAHAKPTQLRSAITSAKPSNRVSWVTCPKTKAHSGPDSKEAL